MREAEATGPTASAARKQAEMDAGVPLAFFFLTLVQTLAHGKVPVIVMMGLPTWLASFR